MHILYFVLIAFVVYAHVLVFIFIFMCTFYKDEFIINKYTLLIIENELH